MTRARASGPLTLFLYLLCSFIAPSMTIADVPGPGNSTCPDSVTFSALGGACFDVEVRDVANNPLAGSSVVVDFGACPMSFCPTQPPGQIVDVVRNTIRTLTDFMGVAHFCICATSSSETPCSATIYADGVRLCILPADSSEAGALSDLDFLEKSHTPDPVLAGDPVTFTLRVLNHGPGWLDRITLLDNMPPGINSPVFTPSEGAYDTTTHVWNGLSFASGDTLIMRIDAFVDADQESTLTNTASVAPVAPASDPNPLNNAQSDLADVVPPPPPPPSPRLQQLDFDLDGLLIERSETGMLEFEYTPATSPAYLNLAARLPGLGTGEWVVRNLYLPSAAQSGQTEYLAARFPLSVFGILTGDVVPALDYALTLTASALSDPVAASWIDTLTWQGTASLARDTVTVEGPEDPSAAPPAVPGVSPVTAAPFLPYTEGSISWSWAWLGGLEHCIDLDSSVRRTDWNGCGPAATAGSMKWLDKMHSQFSIPADLRQTFEQLSKLMYRKWQRGVVPIQVINGKLDFIEAHELPIHVKFQVRGIDEDIRSSAGNLTAKSEKAPQDEFPSFSWMANERNHGEDVEIDGGYYYFDPDSGRYIRNGGHVMMVTGVGVTKGVPYIYVQHDTDQAKTGECRQEHTIVDSTSFMEEGKAFMRLPAFGQRGPAPGRPNLDVDYFFAVERVYSESYDSSVTHPTQHEFREYCEYLHRIVPPGKSLVVDFPAAARDFNMTVYEWRRTPQLDLIKLFEWNRNNAAVRKWVNTTDSCVTLWLHNDDRFELDGAPVPYTVLLSNAAGSGPDTAATDLSDFGGFSLGGADGSSGEFGAPPGPSVTFEASPGCLLSGVPYRLGEDVSSLTLTHQIPIWDPTWSALELRLAVAAVVSPGVLNISCPTTGYSGSVVVDSAGTYVVNLGAASPAAELRLEFSVEPGLVFDVDAIGVPSTANPSVGTAPPAGLVKSGLARIGPSLIQNSGAVRVDLATDGDVQLSVFDVAGRVVTTLMSGRAAKGTYVKAWDGRSHNGSSVSTGVYFCNLKTAQGSWTIRWILMR